MRKIIIPILSLIMVACSSDSDPINIEQNEEIDAEQIEVITYAQYLSFWKDGGSALLNHNIKWNTSLKLKLNGTISEDANATVFFGTKAEVESIWPDMYNEIKDGNQEILL